MNALIKHRFSKILTFALGFVLIVTVPMCAQAQNTLSQRNKPATNDNSDNPRMNPSLYPDGPNTMHNSSTENPLIFVKKRGSSKITPAELKNAAPKKRIKK